ncbi:hypothetical protein [Paenibacillus sp. IITD108]|uniref:hypothetical protein n=1 Tax=Paenibacillus sp. IITD108 TaxID=3116649 RepID=UPI002F4231A2
MFAEERNLSEEDGISRNHSGFGGQVVCGLKYANEIVLEPVAQVFSNIWEDEVTHFPGEGCGDLIHNAPQRCATNKMAAQVANNIVNNLFHLNTLFTHVVNFNAQTCCSGGMGTFIDDETFSHFKLLKQLRIEKNL